jgi:tetratricopeptide (TPR) repeat protein
LDEAISHYTESRELSERIGNLNTGARAEINLGEVHLIRGEWTEAERAFHQALTIWERNDYMLGQAYGSSNMGAVLTRKGMPNEALQYLQRSNDLFTELGARSFLPIVHRHQAAAYLALGDMNKAQEHGRRSLDLARELALTQEEGAAYRTLGMINRKKKNLVQAEEDLEKSVEIFHEAGVQYEEARARYELARVWHDEKKFDRISTIVDNLIEDFSALGAKADLQLATALKASLPQ